VKLTSSIILPQLHPYLGMNVSSVLRERAAVYADKPFLYWEPGPSKQKAAWTYQEFEDLVNRTASGLIERGVRPLDAVMLVLPNSPAFLITWFACARIGAVAVDTNVRYNTDELVHAASLTKPVGIITHQPMLETLEPLLDGRFVELMDDETGLCEQLYGDAQALPPIDPVAERPLCVQFTSGTTARPKAVLYTHANALWGAEVGASHAEMTSSDINLVYAPLFHTMALSWQFLATFWVGGTVVLQPKFSASRFWSLSVEYGCTVTAFLKIMLTTLKGQPVPQHSYRIWSSGAEAPMIEELFGVRLMTAWGMSEVVTEVIIGSIPHRGSAGVIGRLSKEYQARICDERGMEVSAGQAGELRVGGIRGLSLFAGYLGDDAANREAFDEHGFFRTGDSLRRLATGEIQFVTRIKDMLKVGGENVAAAEIERVLNSHSLVRESGVVALRDPLLDEVPVAFVSLTADNHETAEIGDMLISFCREHLADFKVPRAIHVLEELPEVSIGKIAKGQLTAIAQQLAASG